MTRSNVKRFVALPSAARTAVWFAILTVPAAVAAYYRIFSGFAEWDDEGTLIMTVKQYLAGSRLYEEIYSPYGPVYYYYNWLVRSATGNTLDHNTVRITSAVVSLLCPLICAWIVLRLTKSLAAASVSHLLVFRFLSFFTSEPGHPQELCMLLLLCLVCAGILAANPRTRWLATAASGSLAAAFTLVKVNVGIFMILAVALAMLFHAPQGWFSRLAKYAAGAAALLLPFALMRVHLDDPATQAYCFVVTASMLALLAVLLGLARPGWLSFRECWAAAAGFAATLAALLLVLTAQGVPLSRVLTVIVLKHVSLSVSQGTWYLAVTLGRYWVAWALAGLAAAVFCARAIRDGNTTVDARLAPCQVLIGGTGLLIALVYPEFLLGFVTPFCWLLLCPPVNTQRPEIHARMLLATAAVLQTLYAYPLAGSQTYFLRILLVVVAAVSLSDGLRGLPGTEGMGALLLRFSRPAGAVTMTAVLLAYPVLAYRARRLYASLTPLGMPGAERIHAEKEEAEDYGWLVAQLRQNCDTFVGLPGIPSLYLWTGKPLPGPAHKPPGPLNSDAWMLTFSPEEQEAVVDDFSRHPNACAVYSPGGLNFWNKAGLDPGNWPLAKYILAHFKTIGQSGSYQFMVRNERQLDIPAGIRREPRRQPRQPR